MKRKDYKLVVIVLYIWRNKGGESKEYTERDI
jgi:hypothetical protein